MASDTQEESGLDRVQKPDWIAEILGRVGFVEWDRFTVGEMDGYQSVDVYGWIDRDDDYKDFVWSRFWPESETVEYTTSSDEYTEEIQRIWFGEESMREHNPCRRVENTFDVENAVELDEPELATDGGVDQSDGGVAQERGEWTTEIGSDIHEKPVLRNGFDGAVMLMGLPRLGGWTPLSSVKLSHQCRVREVTKWLDDHPGAREIAVLSVDTGEWETVWAKQRHKPTAERRSAEVVDAER